MDGEPGFVEHGCESKPDKEKTLKLTGYTSKTVAKRREYCVNRIAVQGMCGGRFSFPPFLCSYKERGSPTQLSCKAK